MIDRRIVEAWEMRLKVRVDMVNEVFRYKVVAELHLNSPDGRKLLVDFRTLNEYWSHFEAQLRLIELGGSRVSVDEQTLERLTRDFLHLWEGERDTAVGGR